MNEHSSTKSESNKLAFAAVGLFLLVIVIMAASGKIAFINKTTVVPILFIAAALSKKLVPFIREWAIFLCLVVLFDSLRGYVYYLTSTMGLPVYMNYVIHPELSLFKGKILTEWFQQFFYSKGNTTIFDKLLTIIHGSHFLMFLLFGLGVWYLKKVDFPKYKSGILIVMYIGLLFYLLVPTIPPWMAASQFHVLPELPRIFMGIYNTALPGAANTFDTNPIAAMPSLHTAFPTFLMLVSVYHLRWRSIPFILYWLLMIMALFYGGEHYFLDVIAGIILASLAFWLSHKKNIGENFASYVQDKIDTSPKGKLLTYLDTDIKRNIALAIFILALSEIIGQINVSSTTQWQPDEDFVKRELIGHSDMAHFELARIGLAEKNLQNAKINFEKSLHELQSSKAKKYVKIKLANIAYMEQQFAHAARYLLSVPLADLRPENGKQLVISLMNSNNAQTGFKVLDELEQVYACDPGIVYLHTYLHYKAGHLTISDVQRIANSLGKRVGNPLNAVMAQKLQEIVKSDELPHKAN